MSLTSANTTAEIEAQYLDNADYAESGDDGSTSKAKRFVQACRMLLLKRPRGSRHGVGGTDWDPGVLERQLSAAQAWLSGRSDFTGDGATSRFDMQRFRT